MNSDSIKIYLVPRWAGNIHSDWYDWLELLIREKYQIEIKRLEMPDWNEPDIEKSLNYLIKNVPEINENTFFIGHSVGCQAILRFIDNKAKQNKNLTVGGFLFVAGWFSVDKPWISLKPWINIEDLNTDLISEIIKFKKVVISDNDPFTSDYLENKQLWENKFTTNVTIIPNGQHFNRLMEADILKEVDEMIHPFLK